MSKQHDICKKEVLKRIKTIQEAFDNNIIPDSLMIKYLVKQEITEMLKDPNRSRRDKNIRFLCMELSEKYFVSDATVHKYYYSKDSNSCS